MKSILLFPFLMLSSKGTLFISVPSAQQRAWHKTGLKKQPSEGPGARKGRQGLRSGTHLPAELKTMCRDPRLLSRGRGELYLKVIQPGLGRQDEGDSGKGYPKVRTCWDPRVGNPLRLHAGQQTFWKVREWPGRCILPSLN